MSHPRSSSMQRGEAGRSPSRAGRVRNVGWAFVVVAMVACSSRSGVAQSSDPRDPFYNAAVDGTHQDGTLGTTAGFWQQLRDASASRALTQITGPGDGNIWTTINGVQYIQMSTIIDATSAAFFAGKNPGERITAPIPAGQPGDVFDIDGIWLTPGNDLMWGKPGCVLSAAYMDDLRRIGSVIGQAEEIAVPWLLVHGNADTLVTAQDSRDALAQARGPKKLVELDGCDHVWEPGFTPQMVATVLAWCVKT